MRTPELATSQRPCPGELECGDAVLVINGESSTLVAIADGLGHGPHAARAALVFCEAASEHRALDLESIMRKAHAASAGTRGTAAALLRFDHAAEVVEFVGVGNIECMARARDAIRPISHAGVVGHNVRKLQTFRYRIHAGDTIALLTDGISTRFEIGRYDSLPLAEAAAAILRENVRPRDDATCTLARIS